MNISKAYFDTNIFRGAAAGDIPEKDVNRLLNLLNEAGIGMYYTPISYIEIGSHIRDEEKDCFGHFQKALELTKSWCGEGILDFPEDVMARIGRVTPPSDPALVRELNDVRDVIVNAKDYDELKKGQQMVVDGQNSLVTFNTDVIYSFREKYEVQWIADIMLAVIAQINPAYPMQKAAGKCPKIPVHLRKPFKGYVDSPEFRGVFAQGCLCRATGKSTNDIPIPDKPEIDTILSSLEAYFHYYKQILKLCASGYNPQKNKNDYNDLNLLIYLGMDEDTVFVTSDTSSIVNRILGCNQGDRIFSFSQLIKLLDGTTND